MSYTFVDSIGRSASLAPVERARQESRLNLLNRKLDFAVHTLCRELEINHTRELVGNEFAYEPCAVAGFDLSRCWGAAKLTPYEFQVCRRMSIRLAVPAYRYPTSRDRQGAIFCRVRYEFVKHHRHRLTCACG